jgi:hypothetical protein
MRPVGRGPETKGEQQTKQEDTVDKVQRELRILRIYALFSAVLFVALFCLAARGPGGKASFDEIDAKRINIVEPDGKVRLAMANHERMPGGQMAGIDLTARYGNRVVSNNGPATAGLVFFNDEGDECGGLVYGSTVVDGKPKAVVHLSFDHYRQNEAIDIGHVEENGTSRSGLEVVDTGSPFTADGMRQMNAILLMKDGPAKDAAMKEFGRGHAAEVKYRPRLFVGRLAGNGAAAVVLMDAESRPRIRMEVDSSNAPSLQFLDEHGKVTFSLPGASPNNDHPAR